MPTLDLDDRIVLDKGPVKLKPYKERPFIKREFMTDTEILNSAGDTLALDVESFPNYFMCGFKHLKSGKFITIDRNFDPQFLSWILFKYRTIGFNSNNYDLPILWASYLNRDPEFLKNVSNSLILSGLKPKEVAKNYSFKIYETPHLDIIRVCPLRGSLKLYAGRIHAPRLQDLPYLDTKILNEDEIEVIQNYNYNDLDNTHLLFDFMKERIELREAMSLEYKVDVMCKSDAQIAEKIIPLEVKKISGVWPKRPVIEAGTTYKYKVPSYIRYCSPQFQGMLDRVKSADFIVQNSGKILLPIELKDSIELNGKSYQLGIGGLHSQENNIKYIADDDHLLVDRDVTSYYPNAILNMKLAPISMGEPFLNVYSGFKSQRVEAKKNKNFTKDKGLKIFLNGVSGKFSDIWSTMYSPQNTIQMNLTGQLAILMQIDIMEYNGIEAISANTDGAVYYVKKTDYNKFLELIKFWENETQFDTEETQYKIYCARDVNAYFAVKLNDEVKVKGPYSEVGSQSGTQLDNNPINLICSDAIKLFLSKGISIEKTIKECKYITRFITLRKVEGGAHKDGEYLGKIIRWYYAKNTTGTINYVVNGNKVPETDGALPLMDLPDTFPDNIDYEKYIAIAKDILYDVGYYNRSTQLKFF
jgi:hypothetical protein